MTGKLKQAETRSEFAERSVQKLQKEVGETFNLCIIISVYISKICMYTYIISNTEEHFAYNIYSQK